ncbi:hypothetical protein [Streptomyces daghestanicus]|uniref:hypothetical protein n=1 Tax=Streptomyces daghestanicus TaxID=66885 RepID=UPI003558DFC3
MGRFTSGGLSGLFLNTFSLGVYPELVRERERWSHRIGGWPAGLLAAVRVLRADRHPLRAEVGGAVPGRCGCCSRATAPTTAWGWRRAGGSTWRTGGSTSGLVHGGSRPALRLLSGGLRRTADPLPAHAAVQVPRLRLKGVAPGTLLAYDGEVTETEGDVTVEKLPEALTVYRPLPGD